MAVCEEQSTERTLDEKILEDTSEKVLKDVEDVHEKKVEGIAVEDIAVEDAEDEQGDDKTTKGIDEDETNDASDNENFIVWLRRSRRTTRVE